MSTTVNLSVLGDRRRLTAPQAKQISSKLDQFPPLPSKVWNKDFFQNQQNFVPPNKFRPGLFPVSNAMENPKPTYANLTTYRSSRNSRIRLQPKPHEIQNGKYVVSISKEENEMLAQTCKWTIIGKPSQIRPSIDIIRTEFTKIIPGKDLTKPLIDEVILEITNRDGLTEMINQRIEYEIIPVFFSHCKMQGHRDENCRKLHTNLQTKEAENTLSEQEIVQATTNVEATTDTTNLRDSTTQKSKESPEEINEEQE
ncbi:hypothetical protein KY290_015708 [Solanum tuberosum]|uniref:Uncharacterized protein n=1 Tax=Solanum tuberosum TaxID=4113 RepID=A0ABQ7VT96_SOLTU|nr:hypothetical protein KY289_015400 [Solanum tuberosum]KAH0700836.1 hypothetical protein KY284_015051 [Solanum tuberosum]KAH0719036.1 hypothetical protein KY285_015067 [Solanum tuberosum]KAH0771727.1 hypothetical protein KY290_015708 [Solanum tuberosum]